MNISSLRIPKKSNEMIKRYEDYYRSFYLEMIRMSNSNFNSYIQKYIELIENLIKSSFLKNIPENMIRAAIGIISLHVFGYDDFNRLIRLLNRLLPQKDPEYVKFTSWCIGTLIHHPGIEQVRYVRHLFTERIPGWAFAKGQRARHLAAAHLINDLSISAGSTVVVFFPILQSIIWPLVSHESIEVLKATADAVYHFADAIISYSRSDFSEFMGFFFKLATKLLSFGDELRVYIALLLFRQLITVYPEYFTSREVLIFYSAFDDYSTNKKPFVKMAAYSAIISLSRVDSNQFQSNFISEILTRTNELICEFPDEVSDCLCLLIETIPNYMKSHISDLINFCKTLVNISRSPFRLLSHIFKRFRQTLINEFVIDEAFLINLIEYPEINEDYYKFIVNASRIFQKRTDNMANPASSPVNSNQHKPIHQSQSTYDINSKQLKFENKLENHPSIITSSNSINNLSSNLYLFNANSNNNSTLSSCSYFEIYNATESFLQLVESFSNHLSNRLKTELQQNAYDINNYSNCIPKYNTNPDIFITTSDQYFKSDTNSLLAMKILAEIPPEILIKESLPGIMEALESITSSPNLPTREIVPKAIYNVGRVCQDFVTKDDLVDKLFNIALYDDYHDVRTSALKVLYENIDSKIFATPENMKSFQVFVNDDSVIVKRIALQILEKLVVYNPIGVTTITRNALLDNFFIIRHVPGIRKRSRIARILPDLIHASAPTITAYSDGFMELVINIFKQYQENIVKRNSFQNFIEVTSYQQFINGIIESLTILAPYDPLQVAKHADFLIDFLCEILKPESNRSIILSALELLYVLFRPPASSIDYRAKAPTVLSSCSELLTTTDSRKERIALLKVIGAIGILEVHQKSITVASSSPRIYDESLTRIFYHPGRDEERTNCDESWLIQENLQEEYMTVFSTSSLLDIFKDDSLKEFHVEAVQSLVNIFASLNANNNNNKGSDSNNNSLNNKNYMSTSMLHQFDMFVTRILEVLQGLSDKSKNEYIAEMKTYLPLFSSLVHYAQNNVSPFLKDSLELIKENFCNELADDFVQLILSFIDAVKDAFNPYASDTICLLVVCLDNSKINDENLSRTVLKAFSLLGIYASDLLYLIVPQICDAVECEQTLPRVRYVAFQTLSNLMQSVDLFPYLGPIMRALTTGLFNDDPNNAKTKRSAFEFLYVMLKTQGSNFLTSVEPLLESIKSHGIMTDELQEIIKDVKNNVYSKTYRPLLHQHSNNNSDANNKDSSSTKNKSNKKKKSTNRKRSESIRSNYQFLLQLQQLTHSYVFSEDAITMKALTPNLGRDKHLEQWLFSFMLTCISNSPSAAIRACTPLATNYPNLAYKVFRTAFFSCWQLMSDKGKKQITQSFSDLLKTESNNTVNYEIIKLLVFMDKIEAPLEIDKISLIKLSIRYGGDAAAYALHVINQEYDNNPDDFNLLSTMIDLYCQLGSQPNAQGLWSKASLKYPSLNNSELLSKLKMWDQAEPIYREKFERTKEADAFVGLTTSLSHLAMWEDIIGFYGTFMRLERHHKNLVAPYFAQAAVKLGKWDKLKYILQFAPEDSILCKIMGALYALHNKDKDEVDRFVLQGFSLMSSRPTAILADNKQIVHIETMLLCQQLVEIAEMKSWISDDHRKEIEEVWLERLKTAPRDFDLWFGILSNRACFTQIRDPNLIRFFSMKSSTLGTKLHTNAFSSLFPFFDFQTAPDIVKICFVVAHWNTGEHARAQEEMSMLISQLEQGDLLNMCRFIYSNWMFNNWNETFNNTQSNNYDPLRIAYKNLKEIILSFDDSYEESVSDNNLSSTTIPLSSTISNNSLRSSFNDLTGSSNKAGVPIRRKASNLTFFVNHGKRSSETNLYRSYVLPHRIFNELNSSSLVNPVKVIRKWADVNVALAGLDKENLTSYVTNAIDSLTKCATLSPSFPDIVLLLNIFFENAEKYEVFTSTAHKCIEQLPPKMLLQASPQLLVQLSHPSKAVSDFVHGIVTDLLKEHYHELIFAIIVLTKSPNFKRAEVASRIKSEFTVSHPREYIEVILIRKCLLKASVTWTESMSSIVAESIDFYMHNKFKKMKESLESLIDLIRPERAKCLMDRRFQKAHGDEIKKLKELLKKLPSVTDIIEITNKEEENKETEKEAENEPAKEIVHVEEKANKTETIKNNKKEEENKEKEQHIQMPTQDVYSHDQNYTVNRGANYTPTTSSASSNPDANEQPHQPFMHSQETSEQGMRPMMMNSSPKPFEGGYPYHTGDHSSNYSGGAGHANGGYFRGPHYPPNMAIGASSNAGDHQGENSGNGRFQAMPRRTQSERPNYPPYNQGGPFQRGHGYGPGFGPNGPQGAQRHASDGQKPEQGPQRYGSDGLVYGQGPPGFSGLGPGGQGGNARYNTDGQGGPGYSSESSGYSQGGYGYNPSGVGYQLPPGGPGFSGYGPGHGQPGPQYGQMGSQGSGYSGYGPGGEQLSPRYGNESSGFGPGITPYGSDSQGYSQGGYGYNPSGAGYQLPPGGPGFSGYGPGHGQPGPQYGQIRPDGSGCAGYGQASGQLSPRYGNESSGYGQGGSGYQLPPGGPGFSGYGPGHGQPGPPGGYSRGPQYQQPDQYNERNPYGGAAGYNHGSAGPTGVYGPPNGQQPYEHRPPYDRPRSTEPQPAPPLPPQARQHTQQEQEEPRHPDLTIYKSSAQRFTENQAAQELEQSRRLAGSKPASRGAENPVPAEAAASKDKQQDASESKDKKEGPKGKSEDDNAPKATAKDKAIQDIVDWCRRNQEIVNDELKDIRTILMSSISPILCEKTHFYLAVFGTYKPNKPINRIQYFVGQFSVYMSKQQPKDVVVKGEDGKFYQYLLKGHEDLRLDERIMQFFRLINSLMNKETCFNGNLIQTICVMPISHSHGLVQWVPGTETLRNIVEEYRALHHVDPTIEYELANEMSVTSFDYLQPIRKMQIIEEIFKEVPDTDIANSFWLKTTSAELWFKKTDTFAISTSINSIVGYVIGLGDRHPSNLLIDRDSGKVVHIDFGDCFEKAMLRSLLPEVVPFRLTRMIVRAFGAAGVNGIYRSSFVNMSNLLRENARVLVMVLSVFVHEPLAVPDDAGTSIATSETLTEHININSSIENLKVDDIENSTDIGLLFASTNEIENKSSKEQMDERVVSSVEMRKRVMQKLTGNDFGDKKKMSVEEQATTLIKMATDTYNLSKMYSGWCPFW